MGNLAENADTRPGSTRSCDLDTMFNDNWSPCIDKALIDLQRRRGREREREDRGKKEE